ncbi:methionyl-tRNA synthetase [Dictyostelium discoideum AX4]|uniref:Probable methionine--tRNA ligase, mitochondrial n=1 Tax=Dictyostelium discoideum TaxID=44689 RepID=SYMM_DICDI|nr:methionyl-tRNA synthetase [Dictyostelium discoideum AX4]Q54MZ8.1 RecName: Full=Probable methionine--tRNA ligase, mitochondrial; AltName: Full=Mitochondrial methionyl-tRNA synthetase; Short=MtMetRS; Flags: Precursor [Dictyostelium discoideum]EAL64717.1 methionyl-tRNA synthetase [Dictyostelium discoideum AX4]|eukprot:XP_638145.1 methionyl-tRNA synthetase [Dictyostelium discoideum AX4]
MLKLLKQISTTSTFKKPSSINNGFININLFKNYCTSVKQEDKKKVLITTPIFYVNGPPHIGHLYSALLGDALGRWNRFIGNDTLFMTGTDEHGSKVDEAAKKNGLKTIDYCDKISNRFRELFDKADIKYDDFIRTTEPRHKEAVTAIWNRLLERGYIYKGVYKGWYCTSDESFLTDDQVTEGMSPITPQNPISKKCMISLESGHEVNWIEEENYMFKLSEFSKTIENWFEEVKPIFPAIHVNLLRYMLSQGIKDLSISRPSSRIPWGIEVPNDPSQTIYVWLDALTNYLTVTGYPNVSPNSSQSHWSNATHIIGKDIIKFHSVYWPSFLIAADYPLPKSIICHAHWTVNREKMSKSRGNVVDPFLAIDNHGLELIRYFLLKGGGLENDGDWSEHELAVRFKSDLADTYGNLISRCTGKALNPSGEWPKSVTDTSLFTMDDQKLIENSSILVKSVSTHYDRGDFKSGIFEIMTFLYECNLYVQNQAPWKLVPKPNRVGSDLIRLNTIIYIAIEMIRITSLLLSPIIPTSSNLTLNYLSIPLENRSNPSNFKFGYNYHQNQNNLKLPKEILILFHKK